MNDGLLIFLATAGLLSIILVVVSGSSLSPGAPRPRSSGRASTASSVSARSPATSRRNVSSTASHRNSRTPERD